MGPQRFVVLGRLFLYQVEGIMRDRKLWLFPQNIFWWPPTNRSGISRTYFGRQTKFPFEQGRGVREKHGYVPVQEHPYLWDLRFGFPLSRSLNSVAFARAPPAPRVQKRQAGVVLWRGQRSGAGGFPLRGRVGGVIQGWGGGRLGVGGGSGWGWGWGRGPGKCRWGWEGERVFLGS